jgi:hypothetical protein
MFRSGPYIGLPMPAALALLAIGFGNHYRNHGTLLALEL